MFAAVMLDEENAKGVVERALDIKVDHVEISVLESISIPDARLKKKKWNMLMMTEVIQYS